MGKGGGMRVVILCNSVQLHHDLKNWFELTHVAGGKDFNLCLYWKDMEMAKVDEKSAVLQRMRFPVLSVLASLFYSIDGTSCQAEIKFSLS